MPGKVAVIGWGSFVSNDRAIARSFGVRELQWLPAGPELKHEFSRKTPDGSYTLVLDPNGLPNKLPWTVIPAPSSSLSLAPVHAEFVGNEVAISMAKLRGVLGCVSNKHAIGFLLTKDMTGSPWSDAATLAEVRRWWQDAGRRRSPGENDVEAVLWRELRPNVKPFSPAAVADAIMRNAANVTAVLTTFEADTHVRRLVEQMYLNQLVPLCGGRLAPIYKQIADETQAPHRAAVESWVQTHTYVGMHGWIEYIEGNIPVIMSAPHGGLAEPATLPDRAKGLVRPDKLSIETAMEIFNCLTAECIEAGSSVPFRSCLCNVQTMAAAVTVPNASKSPVRAADGMSRLSVASVGQSSPPSTSNSPQEQLAPAKSALQTEHASPGCVDSNSPGSPKRTSPHPVFASTSPSATMRAEQAEPRRIAGAESTASGARPSHASAPPQTATVGLDSSAPRGADVDVDVPPSVVPRVPHMIVCHLLRLKLDCNRDKDEACWGNPLAEEVWTEWHNFIEIAKRKCLSQSGFAHYFDIHGQGLYSKIMVGHVIDRPEYQKDLATLAQCVDSSSIRNLALSKPDESSKVDLLVGPRSIAGLFAAKELPVIPVGEQPFDFGPHQKFFSGGFNTQRHGSMRLAGPVNGTQLEFPSRIRKIGNLRRASSQSVAVSMIEFVEEHYGTNLRVKPTASQSPERSEQSAEHSV
eukprot:TRINITY_DN1165_c0_g3_i1.p1 TRINITY_DN1165_c0_g3~~TRINITY_DN1165_c0_g3_i1.p1  ORF type:complete len:693 (+),score=63.11 TRINITY_DN1165_c0_g3_i1:827-2905(+)